MSMPSDTCHQTQSFTNKDTFGYRKRLLEILDDADDRDVPALITTDASDYEGDSADAREKRLEVRVDGSVEFGKLLRDALLDEITFLYRALWEDYTDSEDEDEDFNLGATVLHHNGMNGTKPKPFTAWELAKMLEEVYFNLNEPPLNIIFDTARLNYLNWDLYHDIINGHLSTWEARIMSWAECSTWE